VNDDVFYILHDAMMLAASVDIECLLLSLLPLFLQTSLKNIGDDGTYLQLCIRYRESYIYCFCC
jgi:hypothetical protein